MDFNVGVVGIANALAVQEKAVSAMSAATILTNLFRPVEDDDDCPYCSYHNTVKDYADTYAAGEDYIDTLYAKQFITGPIGGRIKSRDEISYEFALKNPEFALAKTFCKKIEDKGDAYIESKMREYDRNYPNSSDFCRDAYYLQVKTLYRATHPDYDIVKSAKEETEKTVNVIF